MGILAALGLLAWCACVPGGSASPSEGSPPSSAQSTVPGAGATRGDPGDQSLGEALGELGALGGEAGEGLEGDAALRAAQSIERVMGELGEAKAFERDGDVPEVATWVLESYRDAGATLFEASYLDFLGRAWGCVVADAGWVDVCCVRERASGSSLVEVVRLDAEMWEEALSADAL